MVHSYLSKKTSEQVAGDPAAVLDFRSVKLSTSENLHDPTIFAHSFVGVKVSVTHYLLVFGHRY